MKKFLLLMYLTAEPTPEDMAALRAWFESIGEHVVDSGNPLGAAVEVDASSARALGPADGIPAGYTLLRAASLEAATALVARFPLAGSVRLHECLPM